MTKMRGFPQSCCTEKKIVIILLILIITLPIITLLAGRAVPRLPEIFQVYPSEEPSVSPSPPLIPGGTLNFRVYLEGLDQSKQDQKVTVIAKNTGWQKDALLNSDGTGSVDMSELDGNSTYNFVLYTHPYLTIQRTINLSQLPSQVDFGTAQTGDLDGNDQVNSLDWSWMKKNFGINGGDFTP